MLTTVVRTCVSAKAGFLYRDDARRNLRCREFWQTLRRPAGRTTRVVLICKANWERDLTAMLTLNVGGHECRHDRFSL